MSLRVVDTTLLECVEAESAFPADLRDGLRRAVQAIDAGELEEIFSKHESEVSNFDSTVEGNLRRIVAVLRNLRLSAISR